MAYDAEIRVGTKVDSSQMQKLQIQINKTTDKAAQLSEELTEIKNKKTPTEEYEKLQKEISSAEKELKKMAGQTEKLTSLESRIKKLSASAGELADKMNAPEIKVPTEKYKSLAHSMDTARLTLNGLIKEQEKLGEGGIGKGFDEEYLAVYESVKRLKAELQQAVSEGNQEDYLVIEDRLNRARAILQEMMAKEPRPLGDISYYYSIENKIKKLKDDLSTMESEANRLSESGKAFKVDTDNAEYKKLASEYEAVNQALEETKSLHGEIVQKQEDARNKAETLKAQMEQLVKEGKAFTLGEDTEEYAKKSRELSYLQANQRALNKRQEELIEKENRSAEGFGKMNAAAKKAFTAMSGTLDHVKKGLGKVGNVAKGVFQKLHKGAKKSNGQFSALNANVKRFVVNILLLGLAAKAFRVMVSGAGEGIKEFAKYSKDCNAVLSDLKTSLQTMKYSLGAAFAPIIQTVVPYLTQLINVLNTAISKLAEFFAAITGRSTFYRAISQQADFAGSLEDTAEAAKKAAGALAGFDRLNVINQEEDSGNSGSGGGTGAGFEEVPVDSKWKNIAQWLKDMWEASDFYELGKWLGDKLAETLANISWKKIKKNARKLASSLATLINGFIEGEFDGKSVGLWIGHTLAEAINTGFEFFNEFVHKLNWKSVGKFIADTLNGSFEGIDWELIRDTFITGFKGLADSVNSFIYNFHWDNLSEAISNGVNITAETIYTFFSATEWDELGENLGEQLRKSIEKTDWEEVGRALGSIVQAALDFLLSFVGEQDMGEIAQAVMDTLKGFFEVVDAGDLAKVILMVISIKLAKEAVKFGFKKVAEKIFGGIAASATTSAAAPAAGSFAATLFGSISGAWVSLGGLKGILTADLAAIMGTGTAAEIGVTIGTGIIGGLTGALIGGTIADLLDNYILAPLMSFDEELSEQYKNFKWFGEDGFFVQFKSSLTDGSWKEALNLWGEDIKEAFIEFGLWQEEKVKGIIGKFDEIKTSFKDGSWKEALRLWGEDMKAKVDDAVKWIKSKLEDLQALFSKTKFSVAGLSVGTGAVQNIVGKSNIMQRSINIPQLATGAVLRGGDPFMAILNEQPAGQTNVEAPLSTIKQALKEGMRESGMTGGGTMELNVYLTGKQIYHEIVKQDQIVKKSTGRSGFAK